MCIPVKVVFNRLTLEAVAFGVPGYSARIPRRETRVRDPLGVMVRTRGGYITGL